MVLLTLLAVITVGVIRVRNLFGVVILASIYSFLMASVMIVLDAVDVAMTEASVGAGISTVLMLAALHLTQTREYPVRHSSLIPLLLAAVVGAGLVYGTIDLPAFGAADTPMNNHVGKYYIENSVRETLIPNVVTSVLASYRGYDTLGEVVVVFTAGIGVMLLLRGRPRSPRDHGKIAAKGRSASRASGRASGQTTQQSAHGEATGGGRDAV